MSVAAGGMARHGVLCPRIDLVSQIKQRKVFDGKDGFVQENLNGIEVQEKKGNISTRERDGEEIYVCKNSRTEWNWQGRKGEDWEGRDEYIHLELRGEDIFDVSQSPWLQWRVKLHYDWQWRQGWMALVCLSVWLSSSVKPSPRSIRCTALIWTLIANWSPETNLSERIPSYPESL